MGTGAVLPKMDTSCRFLAKIFVPNYNALPNYNTLQLMYKNCMLGCCTKVETLSFRKTVHYRIKRV